MSDRTDYIKASPEGYKALGALYAYMGRSGLPTEMVNLVYLRASQINGCAYCIDMHSHDLLKQGASIEKLIMVPAWREGGDLFSLQEKAALAWTESVTKVSETGVPDADYAAATAVFSDKELADLTYAIGLINAYNRLAISFRSTPETVAKAWSIAGT